MKCFTGVFRHSEIYIQYSYETDIFILVLQKRNMRLREVEKYILRSHSWDGLELSKDWDKSKCAPHPSLII